MLKYTFISLLIGMQGAAMALKLESKDFVHEGNIPQDFTCDGKGISPELHWSDVPEGTKSLALILEDPDAPMKGGFDHWVLYNIPTTTLDLPQGISDYPKGTGIGQNGTKKNGYFGPCPPTGNHHYYFKLYALDTVLNLPEGSTKQQVLDAMKGHVKGQSELLGRYEKPKK